MYTLSVAVGIPAGDQLFALFHAVLTEPVQVLL